MRFFAFLILTIFCTESGAFAQSGFLETPRQAWKRDLAENAPSKLNVVRLCGFVEGKTGVAVPEWWEAVFSNLVEDQIEQIEKTVECINPTTQKCDVTRVGDGIEIKINRKLDLKLGNDTNFEYDGFLQSTVSFQSGNDIFILNKMDFPSPYAIIKVDAVSKEIKWENSMSSLPVVSGGIGIQHYVEVKKGTKDLVIFGFVFPFIYLSSFEIESGKPRTDFLWEAPTPTGDGPLFE